MKTPPGSAHVTTAVTAAGRGQFARIVQRLAGPFDRAGYTDAKGPYVWEIIRRADEWAQPQGWEPGPSDA